MLNNTVNNRAQKRVICCLIEDGKTIDCCSTRHFGRSITHPVHPKYLPITVPSDDLVYNDPLSGRKEKVECMSFVRSAFGRNQNGPTISRAGDNDLSCEFLCSLFSILSIQVNILTTWMDGSQVYGNADAVGITLRDQSSGKGQLKTSESSRSGHKLPPLTGSCCLEIGDLSNTCPVANRPVSRFSGVVIHGIKPALIVHYWSHSK